MCTIYGTVCHNTAPLSQRKGPETEKTGKKTVNSGTKEGRFVWRKQAARGGKTNDPGIVKTLKTEISRERRRIPPSHNGSEFETSVRKGTIKDEKTK